MSLPRYYPLQTVTVGSGGSSTIQFTSIPAIYTDLILKISARGDGGGAGYGLTVRLNGSTSNFSIRYLEGNGAAAATNTDTTWQGAIQGNTSTASVFSNYEYYLPNYTSNKYKSFSVDSVTENNATTAYADIVAGLWSNSETVSSISIVPLSGSFLQYSSATLYGIKNS